VPVSKEKFLCCAVPGFHIEQTVVCDEGLESVLMHTGQHKYTIASITCPYSTHPVFIHIRKCICVVCSCQIVLHYLPTPVFGDLLVPLRSPARHSAAVWSHYDITVSGHQCKIPARAEVLCKCRLWTTLAVQQCRIFFAGVKVRRVMNPYTHLLAIGGFNHMKFRLSGRNLSIIFLIDLSNLCHGAGFQVYRKQISIMVNIHL